MSYILEALRKAESERRRGAVPDLHAQQVLQGAAPGTEAATVRAPLWPWLAAAALAAMAGIAAWAVLGRQDAPPRMVQPAQAPVPPPSPTPAAIETAPRSLALAPVPTPATQTVSPTSPPGATAPQAADAPLASVRKSSPPKREGAPPVASRAAVQARQVQPAPAAATPAAAAPVPMPSAQPSPAPMPAPTAAPPKVDRPPSTEPLPSARVPALAELPGDLRQQVPALAIGGSVYSPQASARIVVVNGQVFQEGSALTPELKLEQIRQKSAVFSIRGTRFEVPL